MNSEQLDFFAFQPKPIQPTAIAHHDLENSQPKKKAAAKNEQKPEEPKPELNTFTDPKMRKYNAINIGDGVGRNGVTGVVVDKFISVGGLPHLWICRGISDLPYPEVPTENLQVYKACQLDAVVSQQQEEAA